MDTPNRRTNDPEEIAENIKAAGQAAQEQLEQIGEQVQQKGDEIQAALHSAGEAAQNLLQAAGEQLSEYAKTTDEAIRQHPYQSLGIALGAGFLCGYLLSRK